MNKVSDILDQKIQQGGEISPFLFFSNNLEILHHELEQYFLSLQEKYGVDQSSIFRLHDTGETLKIEEVKLFFRQSDVRPRFAFQVFYIERLSRMTPQAQSACLKFFEEPAVGNIIITTDISSSGILDTILSRVQNFSLQYDLQVGKNDFFHSLIRSHISRRSSELIEYFFSAKLEKQEYLDFLKTLLLFMIEEGKYGELLEELQEDISGILKNNLQGKYIVDKYILKI